MKTFLKKILVLLGLTAFVQYSPSQTFNVLYTFTNGADGKNPANGVVLSSNGVLYGTTDSGGLKGAGTLWSINTNGMGFTILGSNGLSSLIVSPPFIYGIYNTTIYSLTTNGTPVTNFDVSPLITPAAITLVGNTLYGVGYTNNYVGVLFSVGTNGSNFNAIYNFGTNDGYFPDNLIVSDGTVYISTANGPAPNFGQGSIFSVSTNGSNHTIIVEFTNTPSGNPCSGTYGPRPAICLLSSNTLYGVWETELCSAQNNPVTDGAVFSISTTGTNFEFLHAFDGITGSDPTASLALSSNIVYGTALTSGSPSFGGGGGILFSVNPDGSDYQTLYTFPGSVDNPMGPIAVSGNTIYGTAGGGEGYGAIWSFTLLPPPILSITLAKTNQVVLSWLTNYQNFVLQSTTNLIDPDWTTVTNIPVIVTNYYDVTDAISFNFVTNDSTIGGGGSTNGPGMPPGSGATNSVPFSSATTFFRLYSTNY